MQKWQLFVIHFILFVFLISIRTLPQADPFGVNEFGYISVKSQDIFLLWMENIGGGNIKNYQKVYRYKTEGVLVPLNEVNIDTMLSKTSRREDSRPGKNIFVDVATGKFNRDPYDDVVAVWRTPQSNQKIEIMISHFDTTGFFTNTTATALDAGENIRQNEEIYVRTGNFDTDSLDEFIVAFRDASDSVVFYLYDVDSTLNVTFNQRFSNTKVYPTNLTHWVRYFIQTADLNDDGKDELVLFTYETFVQNTYVPINVRVYTVESGNIVPKGNTVINVPKPSGAGVQDCIMGAAKGQFDSDSNDEMVFSIVVKSNDSHVSHHYILNVSQNLQNVSVGPRQQYTITNIHSTNALTEFCVAAGDLNNTFNKRDEVIFAAGNRIRVAAVNDDYSFQTRALLNVSNGGDDDYKQSNNYLKVADINMDNRADIVIVKNRDASFANSGFLIATFTFTDSTLADGTERVFARILGDEPYSTYRPYAIAVGNFDGFDFTIKEPYHYVQNNVSQPLVVLNAPPVHFDVLNGQTYDINSCYSGGNCDFFSKYIKTTITSTEVTTRVKKDWGISAGLGGSGSIEAAPLGTGATFNYEAYLLYKHGRNFSKDSTNITTVSVGVEVVAREDDQIYATLTDYDLWEYPVFHGNESFARRSIMTLVPKNVRGQWYPSKSYLALSHTVDHEVSNILSYYPYDTLSNNPNVSQTIRANYVSDSFTLSSNTSYDWNLMFSDFTSVQADTSRSNGIDFKLSFIVMVKFDYNNTKMSTHRTSVTNQINLNSHLGSVNMGIGDVKYTVTPYSYWAQNDALVVDYAVKPELAPPGFPNTWWQDKYGGNSDPTFILPWRLDTEKGFGLGEEAKRFQTSDIRFYPVLPLPGDTLTISARVRNYSLISTPSPVSVSFYVGDPDSGGVPIIGINGSNTVSTNGPILNRERRDVEFKWVLPSGLPPFPRIYAVLDQSNTIPEIHENNNKGFNVLGSSSITGVEDGISIIPYEYVLYQSYPNPFNPSTTIKYSLPKSDIVSLRVFDILGREVAILLDEYKTAGMHTVEFNANGLASGVYFYQLRVQNFVETKKMLLIK